MPRFSLASLLWLVAIVAIAAALPRGRIESKEHGYGVHMPIWMELAYRSIVAAVLLLLVWLGHVAFRWLYRRRQRGLKDSQN